MKCCFQYVSPPNASIAMTPLFAILMSYKIMLDLEARRREAVIDQPGKDSLLLSSLLT
jgi:hypothetical protein